MSDSMLNKTYGPNGEIVAREVEGEFLLVPIKAGVGEIEEALYALNETGKSIWQKLDGSRSVEQAIQELAQEYGAEPDLIEEDVLGLLEALLEKHLLVEKA